MFKLRRVHLRVPKRTFVTFTASDTIKLTYFDAEALGEPVRLALLLSGTKFDDIRIKFNEWPALKKTIPNGHIPIMTIGDDVKTQSKAMLRWVGGTKSATLYPADKLFDIEEVIGDVEDLQRAFSPAHMVGMRASTYGHPNGFESTAEGKKVTESMRIRFVKQELPRYVKRLTDRISTHGGPYLVAGTEPTIADCVAVPTLRQFTRGHLDYIDPNCLQEYPAIITYIKSICALESIQGRYIDGVR
jgi:glutathione S-transferase